MRLFWFTFSCFLLLVLALLLGLNMRRGLNHDEHQFLASGKLVAQGLLPYRDFPYFHAPTLSLIYGLLFRWFDPLLLTARLFSVICAWLGLALIGWQAWQLTSRQRAGWRWPLPISVVCLLIAAPLFIYTSGRAWNHDLPVLLMVGAIICYGQRNVLPHPNSPPLREGTGQGEKKKRPLENQWLPLLAGEGWAGVWLAGGLIGLAAGTRLSFAFLAPAFLLALWWEIFFTPGRKGRELSLALRLGLSTTWRFTVAFLIGFAPALWLCAVAPEQFFFGNVEYVQLNTLYYRSLAEARTTLTLGGKFSYFLQLFTKEPGNLLLGLSFGVALLPVRWKSPLPNPPQVGEGTVNLSGSSLLRLILLALFFMLVGALIATPSQAQYFYALWPLLALGIIYALAGWSPARQRWGMVAVSGAALLAVILAIPQYAPGVGDLFTPSAWYPYKLHRRAQSLATLVGAGKVLTLAPLYPLEGNVPTYPALATGSFAWRVTPLVEPGRRARLGLFDPTQLAQQWQADPPRAVLVGSEQDDAAAEADLVALAQTQGYVPVAVLDKQTLWLAPLAEWGGAIRLGAHTLPRTPLAPGEAFQVVFYLQNVQPIAPNLNRLVRFVGEDGTELLRNEGWPWGSATSTWPQGEVWPDGVELTIPAGAKAGVYRVEVSFYDPGTFDPLGTVVTVGQIEVR